ncbi:MAG: gamma-glutamyltransferase [Gammaproteobacteria bacterium]
MPIRYPSVIGLLSLLLAIGAAVFNGPACADNAIFSPRDLIHPIYAPHGMVATQEATATRIGLDILKRGGNAVDAAVGIGFTLAVTLPQAGNLGGGGFMLIYDAKTQTTAAIDFRETAPRQRHRDMFLDGQGNVVTDRSRFSYLAVGVPGTVAGLALASARYGTLPLADLIAPAVPLAEQGITISVALADALHDAKPQFQPWPASRKIFLKPDGDFYAAGDTLVQPDLAATLKTIAAQGPAAFYGGEIGTMIAADMQTHGGLITLDGLKAYKAVIREPVRGTYRGHEIVSMPPPSSGGVHIVQILNILEHFPIAQLGHNSASTIHRMAAAMQLAYADRAEYLGDPDFVKVPVSGLTSKFYAAELAAGIDTARARPAAEIKPGQPARYESENTTHYSVIDHDGNMVAVTYTLNFSFGSGIVAPGTGILLNNEMDDFSAKPGAANAYGLLGGDANAIAPGKRPLSSMSPTFVFKQGKPLLVTGSPGGSRIITTVLQIIVNVIDHGMNIAAASAAPRIHQQWLPDELRIEEGLSPDTIALLRALGHKVVVKDAMGSTQSIMRLPQGLYGYSDPRRTDSSTAGY